MLTDDLTSIPGLADRHRRMLAMRLGISTYAALAQADERAILDAMSRTRTPPTLQLIREWRDEARRRQEKGGPGTPGWERAATFVLSFEQRQVEGQLERRLVAERTELEPEQPPATWPGWDCDGVCDWLQHRLDGMEPAAEAEVAEAPRPTPAAGRTAPLRFESVAVVDSAGRMEAAADDTLTGQALECMPPGGLEVRVAGATPGTEIRVALRIRGTTWPGWSPQAPATVPRLGPVLIDLSGVAPGRYAARLVAWTPDASAEQTALAGLDLGALTIRAPAT